MTRISKNSDLYSDEMLPVIWFFDAISEPSFVRVIKSLTEGVGAVFEYNGCYFSKDLEPEVEPFDGILFSNGAVNKEVLVCYSVAFKYMNAASKSFIQEYPDKKEILSELLQTFAKKYGINTR
jgi:hypothetical protein